ncbi:MAG: hypothetical protein UZ07_CHB004000609 [Chlorobi bacterium OLB7]|nr:MAG: hypothetical protein UZ07_CHB004000609 [Chlorobi bacterium OLB7]
MDNQRIIGGAAFCGKHVGHGIGIEGIGPKPVHRFGGEGNNIASAEGLGGLGNRGGFGDGGIKKNRLHGGKYSQEPRL